MGILKLKEYDFAKYLRIIRLGTFPIICGRSSANVILIDRLFIARVGGVVSFRHIPQWLCCRTVFSLCIV